MKRNRIIWLIFLLFMLSIFIPAVFSQDEATPVACGTILEGEFGTDGQIVNYFIELHARDTVTITATHFVSGIALWLALYDPAGSTLKNTLNHVATIDNFQVGATGRYKIGLSENNGIGLYTLSIGCILNSGEVIEPGDIVTPIPPAPATAIPTVSPANPAFVGFPGLLPVDFSNAFVLPYTVGTPFPGQIPAAGPGVITFTLNAATNDIFDLKFDRTSGNLNLGVVVLSPTNEVLFYGGLIASNTLSTTLTLPSDGQYTIGVFRVDLVPPAAPEATAFQILGTLNP